MARVTLRDIAKMSGVSHMTVSRVINDDPLVSAETRQRVLNVVRRCDYAPHVSARALIRGETKVLGVLVLYDISKFPTDFLTTVLVGITPELTRNDYHISLHFDQINNRHNLVPLRLLTANRMDGLFVVSVESNANLAQRIAGIKLPIVVINQQIAHPGVSCVDSDELSGGYAVTAHLLDRGRRHVAFIAGDPQFSTSIARRKGYEAALADRGLAPDPELYGVGNFTSTGGYAAAKAILASGRPIDAIFAANDAMAVGVMTAVREAGLAIPRDIALAGFDDNEFAAAVSPTLTTIRKNRQQMGAEAANIMMEVIAHNKAGGESLAIRKTLPTKLIVRESTGGGPAESAGG